MTAPRTLWITVGLPRSGKTTWAKSGNWPIVNPDSIRYALHGQRFYAPAEPMVWAVAQLMVESLFGAGHDEVIVDATNVTEKRRAIWRDLAARLHVAFTLKVFDAWTEECIRRARLIGDEAIVPVIERMAAEWDLPPGLARGP